MNNRVFYKHILLLLAIIVSILCLGYILVNSRAIPIPLQKTNNPLANMFLSSTYNWEKKSLWSASPEVVSSILWDYRCLDTIIMFSILFLVAMLAPSIMEDIGYRLSIGYGVSNTIVKTTTKIIVLLLLVIGVSVIIHGHMVLGGFQGGGFIAILVLLLAIVFGRKVLDRIGWSLEKVLRYYVLSMLLLLLIAFAIPVASLVSGVRGYIMQNQWKPWAPLGFGYSLNLYFLEILYSGALLFFNIFSGLAVILCLSILVYTLTCGREGGYSD